MDRLLRALGHDVVEVHGDVVLRGNPLDLLEEGRDGDRHVAHHENREREEVRDDAPLLLCVDVLALGDRGDDGQDKEDDVH